MRGNAPTCREEELNGADTPPVLFEDSILTLLPASCFVFLAPFRIVHLVKSPDAVRRNGIHVAKLVCASMTRLLHVSDNLRNRSPHPSWLSSR